MEYKICFYVSYKNPNGTHIGNGKLHYCGHTVEEAVAKALSFFMVFGVKRHTGNWLGYDCTSFTIQRGRRRGENVKWDAYKKTADGKALIAHMMPDLKEKYKQSAELFNWEFLDA